MGLHQLIHATGILHGHVDFCKAVIAHLVSPGLFVVRPLLFIVACEQTIFEVEVAIDQERSVRVVPDIILMDFVLRQQVVNHPAEEGNVRADTNRRVIVRNCSRARKARIHHHKLRFAVLHRFGHPLKPAGVCLGGIAAHYQNQICMLNIWPAICHGATPKRRTQTGYRGGVSDTCLRIKRNHTEAARHFD